MFYSSLVWHNDPLFTLREGGKRAEEGGGSRAEGVTAALKKACSLCAAE